VDFPLKIVIFHSYVSLPEGNHKSFMVNVRISHEINQPFYFRISPLELTNKNMGLHPKTIVENWHGWDHRTAGDGDGYTNDQ
jgi:hypothetical protein